MHVSGFRKIALALAGVVIALTSEASAFVLTANKPVSIYVADDEPPVVHTALTLLASDLQRVLNAPLQTVSGTERQNIVAGSLDGPLREFFYNMDLDLAALAQSPQGFIMLVDHRQRLVIIGSDGDGTAYGLIELTRMLGVSPWEWWADVEPEQRTELRISDRFTTFQRPDVPYRGIFINDEDWGMLPWASTNYEPNAEHAIGPKTTERIFQLMLRLRANLYWPPMHPCTKPFFLTQGVAELADRYGIAIGTSHCEPMACNAAGEWSVRGRGDYNFMTNREAMADFWRLRAAETAAMPMVYTLGLRGVHDGAMLGAKTAEEQKEVLPKVFELQRQILAEEVDSDVTAIPQVFIPYKEVMDAYNLGLEVPDDVTLLWSDDNYGYIRHFPTEAERKRQGGNGVYYHISYWGRPHDYLWLGTASPYLLFQQLSEAYYSGAQRMWVLNVGDIKPSEYQISLFMDMAWDLDAVRQRTVGGHMEDFYVQNIGRDIARLTAIYMKDHYHLSFQRKPEHLAGTRVEEPADSKTKWDVVRDLPWSEKRIRARLERYDKLERNVLWIADSVRRTHPARYDAFYQLVEYPVLAAAAMNDKFLTAQLARHGKSYAARESVAATWQRSDQAHTRIQELTARYNEMRGGKWRGIMDAAPRGLTVFKRVPHTQVKTPLPADEPEIASFYGASYNSSSFSGNAILDPVLGLGASIRAMPLPKDCSVSYNFKHAFGSARQVEIELHMLPTHPIEKQQRVTVSFDGGEPEVFTYDTVGRSEEWKQNVIQGYAVVTAHMPVVNAVGTHTVKVGALDEGVVVDQVFVRPVRTISER
jgi:hypothetical protein